MPIKHVYDTVTSVEDERWSVSNQPGCTITLADGTTIRIEPMSTEDASAAEGDLVLIDFENADEGRALLTCFGFAHGLVQLPLQIPLANIKVGS